MVTTDSRHSFCIYPNLVKDFQLTGINQVWIDDITYIRLLYEFVYLVAILDAFSRKTVGWVLGRTLSFELTPAALKSALRDRKPPEGCIHHSDSGIQYACTAYVKTLQEADLRPGMALEGNSYDNATMESFF